MTFDASKHLIKVQGKQDYLEVKWRLVWLHDRHPGASIKTDLVMHNDNHAVVSATVTIPQGDGTVATFTGWKSCPMNGKFPAIEKAETGAIGRALAHAGLGTQFAGEDVDEGLEDGQLADSPVQFTPHPQSRQAQPQGRYVGTPTPEARAHEPARPAGTDEPATAAQLKAIFGIGRSRGMSPDDVKAFVSEQFKVASIDNLPKRQASILIDQWQADEAGVPA